MADEKINRKLPFWGLVLVLEFKGGRWWIPKVVDGCKRMEMKTPTLEQLESILRFGLYMWEKMISSSDFQQNWKRCKIYDESTVQGFSTMHYMFPKIAYTCFGTATYYVCSLDKTITSLA